MENRDDSRFDFRTLPGGYFVAYMFQKEDPLGRMLQTYGSITLEIEQSFEPAKFTDHLHQLIAHENGVPMKNVVLTSVSFIAAAVPKGKLDA